MSLNLGFFLRESAKNLRLNPLMSLTAITTTFVCLLVLGLSFLVSAHVESLVRAVGQNVGIEAYFPGEVSEEEAQQTREVVEGYPEVESVSYVSREEAQERFRSTLGEQADLYEDLGPDALPASLEVTLEDPADATAVAERLEGEGFAAEDLSYPQQTIERLNRVTDFILWGLWGATVLFLASSVLLVSNAIRLSIFARRQEIEVMKLVGASNNFVRTPFLLEGLVQGIVGALLAGILVLWANAVFVDWAQESLPFFPISADAVNGLWLLLVLVLIGAVIGVVGSFVSVTRFLKV